MNNLETFFNFTPKKIEIGIFDNQTNNKIYTNKLEINFNLNDLDTLTKILNHQLKDLIIEVENKIEQPLEKINLMIENQKTLIIDVSIKKIFDNSEILKSNIEYIIQDLKQQVSKNNPNMKINHILIKEYILNGSRFDKIPIGCVCKDLIIQVQFICLSKDFLNCLQNIFRNHQINFKSIICTNYAKSLLHGEIDNFMEAGSSVLRGYNLNEVFVYPQKPSKMGFFEKLFHIFS